MLVRPESKQEGSRGTHKRFIEHHLSYFWFYNLFWGAKVTVQMRVLSAPTFFSIKK
ncbi:hypothetical protein Acin_0481 [Acidaminococcus intestini RyC-MR95]|uniref:Uncharacterized protein n=1 Tax=Acidaminococcus intestini (strain RyC-MR95) TaxID=568816 RepID=G4Q925_ACIIR|nr:hypothetical protein Acin_0481 [Acidaminococcus intestini RyC-MR95]